MFAYRGLFFIQKWSPEIFKVFTTFYDVSVLSDRFSKAERRQFGALETEGLIERF